MRTQIFVDNFHFKNHSLDDDYCQEKTNPKLYTEQATDSNSEVCEQLFTWLSRFKFMIHHMGYAKATLFMQEMKDLHNEHTIESDCLDVDFMPSARLAEVRAAYDLAAVPDSAPARLELSELLLASSRPWSPELLAQHRARIGGPWRDVHAKQLARKRSAAAESSQAASSKAAGKRRKLE